MFDKGEYIVYGSKGICEVRDVTTLNMEGAARNRLYYVLCPSGQRESKIFVPVDSDKTVMRRIITGKEAEELIQKIPDIQEIRVEDDKLREEKYKECMRTCECQDWVRIIKTLYVRIQKRLAQGKKVTVTDERYFRIAEDNLYSELSLALNIPKEEMEQYITAHMK